MFKTLLIKNNKRLKELNKKIISLPRINLNPRQLCDLELLINGGFFPLEGFLDEKNYNSVVTKMRLINNILWPIPIVLDVPNKDQYKINSELVLCDEYGKPLALMNISSIFKPDKKKEAKNVYGTKDENHPGVNYLFNHTHQYFLGGKVIGLDRIDRYDFLEYRQEPEELRTWFKKQNWKTIIGFQTRNPLHKAHYYLIKSAAEMYKAKILLHPTVGLTKEGDIDYITRIRCYIKLYQNHLKKITKLSLIPLAMRMAGPKEAVLHAIVRKNYGCTHFVIGRDHAGPGNKMDGTPFYHPYEAQEMAKKYEKELGISIVTFKEMVYVEEKKTIPSD